MASGVEPEPEPEPPHVISLGTDCFWRTQATRLGWVAGRLHGYESGPFDIAYHSYAAVCSLIRRDFAGYMGTPNSERSATLVHSHSEKLRSSERHS
eukprot:COSAG02_NODE_2043_length_10026_cov_10.550217_8_plen_96_part_00